MAPRIAVYLDCSSSMAPYLDAVEAEASKQFPEADVFKVPAIKVWVDGVIVRGGATSVLPHKPVASGPTVSLDTSGLSPTGKAILARYAGNFEVGSIGRCLGRKVQAHRLASPGRTAQARQLRPAPGGNHRLGGRESP